MWNNLDWHLGVIAHALDDLPRWAAMWPAMDATDRTDTRLRWSSALHQIDHLRRYFRMYSRGNPYPDWWIMLQLQIEEAEPMLTYMGLTVPRFDSQL